MINQIGKGSYELIDFGLSERFIDPQGKHVRFETNQDMAGPWAHLQGDMHEKKRKCPK